MLVRSADQNPSWATARGSGRMFSREFTGVLTEFSRPSCSVATPIAGLLSHTHAVTAHRGADRLRHNSVHRRPVRPGERDGAPDVDRGGSQEPWIEEEGDERER